MRQINHLLNALLHASGAILFILACASAWPPGPSHTTAKEALFHPAFRGIATPDTLNEAHYLAAVHNFARFSSQDKRPAPRVKERPSEPVVLKSVKVWFETTDNEKEKDTKVSVYLQTPESTVVAKKENISGDFRSGSTEGPYKLALPEEKKIKKDDISGYSTTVEITVAAGTEDTWNFNYIIELTFTDESTIKNTFSSVTLSEKDNDRSKSFRIQK